MPRKKSVERRVIESIARCLHVKAGRISLASDLVNDLGMDSLESVDLTMALEDKFTINIPDGVLEVEMDTGIGDNSHRSSGKVQTVGQLIDYIKGICPVEA